MRKISKNGSVLRKSSKQQEFLKRKYEEIEMPLDYAAKDSWDTMAMYAQTYGIILAVVIGFWLRAYLPMNFVPKPKLCFFYKIREI